MVGGVWGGVWDGGWGLGRDGVWVRGCRGEGGGFTIVGRSSIVLLDVLS